MAAISLDTCYLPSSNVVYREIEGEIVLVPIRSGIGDLSDELFSLNATGRAIWDACDGKRSVSEIIATLCATYDAPRDVIERDVLGLIEELCARDILAPSEQ